MTTIRLSTEVARRVEPLSTDAERIALAGFLARVQLPHEDPVSMPTEY